jgi:hypothetical protein
MIDALLQFDVADDDPVTAEQTSAALTFSSGRIRACCHTQIRIFRRGCRA